MAPWLADFVFAAVNFLLLAGGLGWLLFKPVRKASDDERARHARIEAEAAAKEKTALEHEQQARAALDDAAHTAARARGDALLAAHKEADAVRADAERAAAAARAALERELDARRRQESERLAATVGRIAADGVRRLLDAVDGPALDDALVRAARAQVAALPHDGAEGVVVEAARPLSPASKSALEQALGVPVDERAVPALGAGVRVVTPAGQVDASAVALAREASRQVAQAAAAGARDG